MVKIYKGAMEDMCECGHLNGIHSQRDDHCLHDAAVPSACKCRKFKLDATTNSNLEYDALVKMWLERL